MLLSLALIFTVGLILGELFGKLNIPKFLGMIITGIILGPYALDLISGDILQVSGELRTIALVVILLRAGLSLDLSDLKKIGRPAILLSFIPATLELIGITLVAPLLFDITYLEAAILGSVIAAVSPAVIVPKMIKLIDHKWGSKKRIPHMILASASVDDVFVIVLFTSLLEMYTSGSYSFSSVLMIPVAIILGVVVGIVIGYALTILFAKLRVRDTVKLLIILASAFFVLSFESYIDQLIPISGLLSVMVIGITFLNTSETRALRLRKKFDTVWVFTELVLFVLVGAAVDISIALSAGLFALIILLVGLTLRVTGVQLSLLNTKFNKKEKIFCGISFIPKATVQAAIGAIPLALGVASGELILAIAVFSIMVTAPLGAILIDFTYKKLLDSPNS